MQYVLSEEEYQALKNKAGSLGKKQEEVLQKLCTEVANHKPIKFWGREEAGPWGCKLTMPEDEDGWYCDECPVQKECPCEYKSWSQ